MEDKLFISILICCYNSENYITKTLNSILSQNYKNYEIIIVDDGSTDRTKKIIEKKLKNVKYHYHFHTNRGLSESRNIGIEISKSNYVFILDHDDQMMENRLSKQVQEIIKNENCAVYFGNCYIGNDNNLTKFDLFKKKYNFNLQKRKNNNFNFDKYLLAYGCFIPSSSVVINKKFIKYYKFDKRFSYVADYDFFINLASKFNFFKSNNVYAYWNINENQISSLNINNNYAEIIKMYNKFFLKNYKYLLSFKILANYLTLHLKKFYWKINK